MFSADRTPSPQGSPAAKPTGRQPRPEGPQEQAGPPSPEGGLNDSELAGSKRPRPESEPAPPAPPTTKVANTTD